MTSFLRTFCDNATDLQVQAGIAVVIPTLLRPTLTRAVQSIFAQTFTGRVQILIGVDAPDGALDVLDVLDEACRNRPGHCTVQVLYPGYSTAMRRGGMTASRCGGALRCMLSLLANSRYVAYLDDDNWWHPEHLRTLREAVDHAEWAFSLRWFVHPVTARPVCVDIWESVGIGKGVFAERFGGFVDPNCLLINKPVCEGVFRAWNTPLPGVSDGHGSDRVVFDYLRRNHWSAGTNQPTAFYVIDEADPNHPIRAELMGEAYIAAGTAP